MSDPILLRLRGSQGESINIPVLIETAGTSAAGRFERLRGAPGTHVLLVGDRDYLVSLAAPADDKTIAALEAALNKRVGVQFPGRNPVRRRLKDLSHSPILQRGTTPVPLDLTAGRKDAPPLWLLDDGSFAIEPGHSVRGISAGPALVTAARWISSRRTTTFERLFPPSAFHPDEPIRMERLSATQATGLLAQARSAIAEASVTSELATKEPLSAAQIRSAALTVLSHIVATALRDPEYRGLADEAATEMFALVEKETGDTAAPALRAHAIALLSMRAPALAAEAQERARKLVRGLVREAPPYDSLVGPWRFGICCAYDFHEGVVEVFIGKHGFSEIPPPQDAPTPRFGTYRVLKAPFRTPAGDDILLFARPARPDDENIEMGEPLFHGLFINRHAQLGSYDMRALTARVRQSGYKVMMNAQCAGMTTRFAIARAFPDADIYSSWDSTYFHTGEGGKVSASEGVDCFVALLRSMSERKTHAEIEASMKKAQWHHAQARFSGFSQFVGPGNPLVVARFQDVNRDGRADLYDGFLDFTLADIAEDIRASLTPRDPGLLASQIGGEAATGLGWAAGSMNRVTQYADLWVGLPGQSELFYAFHSAGFYSQKEPPEDVLGGLHGENKGLLPAVVRYIRGADGPLGVHADVMFHSYLAHSGKEMKRLLVAADALWRAFDAGLLSGAPFDSPEGKRAAVLLTLAGLLEFPSDQNFVDGLWAMALEALRMPPVSRSLVRACITEADHHASNYYGSVRAIGQLLGDVGKAEPLVLEQLKASDPSLGRAKALVL